MDGIWSMPLDIGVTAKFMDLMALHIPTLNTTTKITGESKEERGEDGLGLSPTGCTSPNHQRRISSMSKKVNPRRQPASKADVKRAELRGRDDGIKFASALFLMALRDKEGFDLEALQKVWKEVGDLADSIAEGYCSIEDLHTVLESEAGARIVGGIALE